MYIHWHTLRFEVGKIYLKNSILSFSKYALNCLTVTALGLHKGGQFLIFFSRNILENVLDLFGEFSEFFHPFATLQRTSNTCCFLNFLFINDHEKNVSVSTKRFSSSDVFNTDNKKCVLSTKSLEWFLKDHVTLMTEVMMLKIQICHHRNKLHFKIY